MVYIYIKTYWWDDMGESSPIELKVYSDPSRAIENLPEHSWEEQLERLKDEGIIEFFSPTLFPVAHDEDRIRIFRREFA